MFMSAPMTVNGSNDGADPDTWIDGPMLSVESSVEFVPLITIPPSVSLCPTLTFPEDELQETIASGIDRSRTRSVTVTKKDQ
jgi:hypothetical protein